MNSTPRRLALLLLPLLLMTCSAAEAHIIAARLGDFYTGALHPLTDLQDALLWLALGVLAGAMGADRCRWLVVLVPLGLLAGFSAALGLATGALAGLGMAALTLLLGLLLASGWRLPVPVLAALGLGLAACCGAGTAQAVTAETNRGLFAAGLAMAGYVAITLVMALTVRFRRGGAGGGAAWRGVALRVCGSWIAAVGLMMGGFALKAGGG